MVGTGFDGSDLKFRPFIQKVGTSYLVFNTYQDGEIAVLSAMERVDPSRFFISFLVRQQ